MSYNCLENRRLQAFVSGTKQRLSGTIKYTLRFADYTGNSILLVVIAKIIIYSKIAMKFEQKHC